MSPIARDFYENVIGSPAATDNKFLVLSGVEVWVYPRGVATLANFRSLAAGLLATIYQADTGVATGPDPAAGATGGPNPFVTGITGSVQFWAERGAYEIFVHDLTVPARIGDRKIGWISGDTDTDYRAASTTVTRESGVTGEANPRWRRLASGALLFGAGGASAIDVQLERSAAGRVRWGSAGGTLYEGLRFASGTIAARPAASAALEGLLYHATDAGWSKVEGGAWVALTPGTGEVTQAMIAAGVTAFGPYTKVATGTNTLAASTSTLTTHGLGTTALAVLYVLMAGGLIAGNRGVDSYDVPNATQFRIYWPGTPAIVFRWFAFA